MPLVYFHWEKIPPPWLVREWVLVLPLLYLLESSRIAECALIKEGGVRQESFSTRNVKGMWRHLVGVRGLLWTARGHVHRALSRLLKVGGGGYGTRVWDPFEGWDPGNLRRAPRQDSGRGPRRRLASHCPRVESLSWKRKQMMGRATISTGAGLRRVLCDPEEISGPTERGPLCQESSPVLHVVMRQSSEKGGLEISHSIPVLCPFIRGMDGGSSDR